MNLKTVCVDMIVTVYHESETREFVNDLEQIGYEVSTFECVNEDELRAALLETVIPGHESTLTPVLPQFRIIASK